MTFIIAVYASVRENARFFIVCFPKIAVTVTVCGKVHSSVALVNDNSPFFKVIGFIHIILRVD